MTPLKKMIHMGSGWDPFFANDEWQEEFEEALDLIVGFEGTSQWNVHKRWAIPAYDYHNVFSETTSPFAVYQLDRDGAPLWLDFAMAGDGTFSRRSMDLKSEVYRQGFIDSCKEALDPDDGGAAGMFFDDVNADWERMFTRQHGDTPLMSFGSSFYDSENAPVYRNKVKGLGQMSVYLPLDAGSYKEDQSPQNRDASLQGSPTWDIGNMNAGNGPLSFDDEGCTMFDGATGVIRTAPVFNPFVIGAARTFFGWARRETNTGNDCLVSADGAGQPWLRLNAGGNTLTFDPQNGVGAAGVTWDGGAAVAPGTWFHWALVYGGTAGGNATLYINGVSLGAQVVVDGYGATPGNVQWGGRGGLADHFHGRMAHVGVVGGALTAAQILDLYNWADDETSYRTGWAALLGDFLEDVTDRIRTESPKRLHAKFIGNPFWSQLYPLRWGDVRFEKIVDSCDYHIIEHGHSDSGLTGHAPGIERGPHWALRSQFLWVDYIHERGKNYILYTNSDDTPDNHALFEVAAFMAKMEEGDIIGMWAEDSRWPNYHEAFDYDFGERTWYIDSNITDGPILIGFEDGRVEFTPGAPELGAAWSDLPIPDPVPSGIRFNKANTDFLIYSMGQVIGTDKVTFAALVRKTSTPSGRANVVALSSTGVNSPAGGKASLGVVNDDGDTPLLDGGGGTWQDDISFPTNEWCFIAATKNGPTDPGTFFIYPLEEGHPIRNLATNPKAQGLQTAGWSLVNSPVLTPVNLDGVSGPVPPAELTGLVSTGFRVQSDASEGAQIMFPVEEGKTYRVSMYIYIDTLTAPDVELQVRDSANAGVVESSYAVLDTWARKDVTVVADETGTWRARILQDGAGASDLFFTAVLISEGDKLHPYFDGDMATSGFQWEGTPGQSVSRTQHVDAGVWQEAEGWAARPNFEQSDRIVIGAWHAISDHWDGDVAVVGIWNSRLNNESVKELCSRLATDDWYKKNPALLLEGRQGGEPGLLAPPFEVLDGTSVLTDDAGFALNPDLPPGWKFGAPLTVPTFHRPAYASPPPNMGLWLYERMQPFAYADDQHDFALRTLCEAIGGMFDELDLIVRDELVEIPGSNFPRVAPGWSQLVDINRVPPDFLNWLGQFIGSKEYVRLSNETDQQYIDRVVPLITARLGWERGSPAAMIRDVQETLTGTKQVYLLERHGSPYRLTVSTLIGETPDRTKTRAAAVAQKPAGIVMTHEVVTGGTFNTLRDTHTDFADVLATFADFNEVRTNPSKQ